MKKEKLLLQTAMTLLVFVAYPLSVAETIKYTWTVFGSPVKHLMPLGNGDAVLMIESSGILALSGNPPTLNTVTCSGMGYQTAEKKRQLTSTVTSRKTTQTVLILKAEQ